MIRLEIHKNTQKSFYFNMGKDVSDLTFTFRVARTLADQSFFISKTITPVSTDDGMLKVTLDSADTKLSPPWDTTYAFTLLADDAGGERTDPIIGTLDVIAGTLTTP